MAALDLDQLMEAPNLKLLIEQAQLALRDEARRRERFYDWVREDHKAEFINGEIIMHSPVKEKHWAAVGNLFTLLSLYAKKNRLGRVASEKAMVSLTRNDYEPDICFWANEKAADFQPDQTQHPAPDFVVEVLSKGTVKKDRGTKKDDYAAHGIGEYWIIDADKQHVEQYVLNVTLQQYEPEIKYTINAEITSREVANFTIPVRAIFDEQVSLNTAISLISD